MSFWGLSSYEACEVFECCDDPLVSGPGGAASFGDDDAGVRVLVGGFGVGLSDPCGGVEAASVVFAFDGDGVAVRVGDAADVSEVAAAGLDLAVDAVVVEGFSEVVGDGSFECGAGSFGGVPVSCHLSVSLECRGHRSVAPSVQPLVRARSSKSLRVCLGLDL